MKKVLIAAFAAAILFSALAVGVSAGFLGSGAAVIANDVTLIKAAISGEPVSFSDTDFKCALGITGFRKLTVTSLPSSTEGVLTIGERRVSEGQTIKRRALASLVFTPSDDSVIESSFGFTVDGATEDEIKCIIRYTDKVNYAPKLDTDAGQTLSVTTQTGISVYGSIPASDPEGDDLEYILVRGVKRGKLELDSDSGEWKYTPSLNYDGKDSFVFVVRDEYGNYTEASTVSLKVTERLSEVIYVDMEESPSYNAAVVMTANGIMSGKRIGDDMYFLPDEAVTRAEFVAMAMKALGIRRDSTLTASYFDDNDEIPASLVGYVATAARAGIVNGAFDGTALNFRPNDKITFTEAAIVLSNIIEISGESAVFAELDEVASLPVWARSEVGAIISVGIFDKGVDLAGEVSREACAECLYRAMQNND